MFVFNLFFWLMGTAVFLVGIWAAIEKTAISQMAEVRLLPLPSSPTG